MSLPKSGLFQFFSYKLVVFSPDGDEISDDEAVLNGDDLDLADDDQIEIRRRIIPNSQ